MNVVFVKDPDLFMNADVMISLMMIVIVMGMFLIVKVYVGVQQSLIV